MLKILDDNPVIGGLFTELRDQDRQQDRARFRENLVLLGSLMAYEIAAGLDSRVHEVQTPLGRRSHDVLAQPPILVSVLRAALPFWDGFQNVFRDSDSMILGAARREDETPNEELSIGVDLSYAAIPEDCEGKTWIFTDPMLATGSTLIDIHKLMLERGIVPGRVVVAAAIGYRGAATRLEREIPGVEIWMGSCDEELDERGYIVPGLGDAGDLCFGAKRR